MDRNIGNNTASELKYYQVLENIAEFILKDCQRESALKANLFTGWMDASTHTYIHAIMADANIIVSVHSIPGQ